MCVSVCVCVCECMCVCVCACARKETYLMIPSRVFHRPSVTLNMARALALTTGTGTGTRGGGDWTGDIGGSAIGFY